MAEGKSRKFIKNFLNVPRWMDANQLIAAGASIKSLAKTMITIKQPQFEETFDDAVKRMGLTEEDLLTKQKYCLVFALIYLVCATLMFSYMCYLIVSEIYLSSISALALTLLLLSFFFREHFWYTQIKNKRLGFTFKEWLFSLF